MSYKNWCFTLNNYSEEEIVAIKDMDYKYLVFGYEVGAEETPHLQGYVELKDKVRLPSLKKILPRAHLEPRRGTSEEASVYCKKDGNFFEDGTISTERMTAPNAAVRRTAALKALQADNQDQAIAHIREELPYEYLVHGEQIERNIKKVFKAVFKHTYTLDQFTVGPIEDWSKCYLFYGGTSIGKTHFACAHFENPLLVSHMDKLREFDKHDGIVFDDISFTHHPATSVIHLLDMDFDREIHCRFACAHIPAKTRKIFTFNSSNPFYDSSVPEEQKKAIDRRVQKVEFPYKLFK